MSHLTIGYLSIFILLLMIFLRAPIALAMLLGGMGGIYLLTDSSAMFMAKLKVETYSTFSSYSLGIVPMFLLMGQFASLSGMSKSLFKMAEAFLGHKKGGISIAAIGACAGFGAICGSSLATAATMSRVALPELRKYGYSGGFSSATLAAGGTLGILIPPSVVLVIYALLTQQNIAKLFLVAFIPGIIAAIFYMITISIYVRVHPENAGRQREPATITERKKALIDVWPVLMVFGLVIGGIYFGWFTPTEGAAVGAFATGLIALLNGNLTFAVLAESLKSTAIASLMIFFIILGASFYNSFLALAQIPQDLSKMIGDSGFNPWFIMVIIIIFYLILGCFMDSLSMILLTIPIFFPLVSQLDYGLSPEHFALWFGVLVLIVVEVGLITPPVGLNLFILNSMDPDTPLIETYKAVAYFVASDLIRVTLLIIFPSITLFVLG